MPLVGKQTKRSGGVEQEVLPVGSYPCRVAQVIELGVQFKERYNKAEGRYTVDETKAPTTQVMVTYEFTTEFVKDADGNDDESKPRWYSEQLYLYPLDVDMAKSTKRYNNIDPSHKKGGDWSQLVGAPCSVLIQHSPTGKARVGQVMPPQKGSTVAKLKNDPKVFTLDNASEENLTIFESLPQWVKDKITSSLEFSKTPFGKLYGGSDETSSSENEEGQSSSDEVEQQDTTKQGENTVPDMETVNETSEEDDLDW